MKAKALTFLKYALPLVVAFLLLKFYVFKEIRPAELMAVFRRADYTWLLVSGLLAIGAHLSRAYRWKLLLQPVGHSPNLFKMFLAVMVGYFANLLLPRMGEVTRCGVLNRMDNVPVNAAFGTVVAERIFDVVMLLIVFLLTFVLEFGRLSQFLMDFVATKTVSLRQVSLLGYVLITGVALLSLAAVIAAYKYRARFDRFTFLVKLKTFVRGMMEGLLSIRRMKRRGEFVLYTVLIWVLYYFMTYVLFFSFDETRHLGYLAGLTVLLMGSVGNSAPVQGGTGTFHILVGNALVFYGLSQESGITLATFMWASQTSLILVLGGVCFLISVCMQRNRRVPEETITAIRV